MGRPNRVKRHWKVEAREAEVECYFCGEPVRRDQEADWHHTRFKSNGGANSNENLRLVHKSCHRRFHDCWNQLPDGTFAPRTLKPGKRYGWQPPRSRQRTTTVYGRMECRILSQGAYLSRHPDSLVVGILFTPKFLLAAEADWPCANEARKKWWVADRHKNKPIKPYREAHGP